MKRKVGGERGGKKVLLLHSLFFVLFSLSFRAAINHIFGTVVRLFSRKKMKHTKILETRGSENTDCLRVLH